jgi:hypothetical protein
MAKTTISMNQYGIVDLALHGQEARVEDLFRRLNLAMRRLKLPLTGGRGFRKAPGEVAAHPGLHDVQRWLDSVQRLRKNKEAMTFIAKLYYTCRGRVRPEVLKKMESDKYLEHDPLV